MNALRKLTLTNIKRNKKRTIVTMLGVALSTALIFVVIAIPMSYSGSAKQYQIDEYGDFYQSFEDIPGDKVSIIEQAYGVEKYYYSKPVALDGEYEFYNANDDPYPTKLYERIDSLTKQDRTADKSYTVYVRYTKPQRHERYGKDIVYALQDAGIESIKTRTNDMLLSYDGDVDYNTTTVITALAALIIGLVVISSIFTIRNSFNISTTERAREFGMLSSIGATPRQIRRSVFFEAIIIGAFAVPVGIVIGIAATFALLAATNVMIDLDGKYMYFYVEWWLFLADIALGFLVVWMASASAAIRAGRLSPIEAIRGTQDIKLKNKKLKTNQFIASYFGIGGVIADKNLKRSRQKYRTTVISIVVSVAVFVGLSSFAIDGHRIVEQAFPNYNADMIVLAPKSSDYRDIAKHFDMHDYAYYQDLKVKGAITASLVSRDYFEKYARSVGVNENFDHVVILNDNIVERHSNGATSFRHATSYKDGDNVTITTVQYDSGSTKKADVIITKTTDSFPMGMSASDRPQYYISEDFYALGDMVIAEDYHNMFINLGSINGQDVLDYIKQTNEKRSEAETILAYDMRASLRQANNVVTLLSIFMYGFVAVIALIGVTNIFNTITTNIMLRAKEFAILKSIGMTDQEFNRMVRLESILYTLRALIIGLPIGAVITYGIHYMLQEGGINLDYVFPIMPVVISVIVVTAMIAVIMRYSVRQVSKQNIIETIRREAN